MPDTREIVIKIPAASDEMLFSALDGSDEISAPFVFSVLAASKSLDIKPDDVLGTAAVVTVGGETPRHFHGLVATFGIEDIRDDHAHYRMSIRPWLWFLSLRTDNRIFQAKTAVEIIEDVFKIYPLAVFEKRLQRSYPPREYCVQYGESDLNFVQRLMEHEGIGYFFEHTEDAHTLVLFDANVTLKPAPGAEVIPYEADSRISFKEGDFITSWLPVATVRPGKYVHTDYDFEKPSSDLMSITENPLGHEGDKGENYFYPGVYTDHGRGDTLSALRLDELQAPHVRVAAQGTARPLWSGRTFKLDLFPREAENGEYIVISTAYRLWDDQYRSGQSRAETGYEVSLSVMPIALPFRPAHRTPRPVMKGLQTAKVVGPAGAEIFSDKYARVKVQFHWDRLGKHDENTTCFIRVSQTWAGAGWGFIQIPRIGQEVIVDFLEGNPDCPIITGRVYNAEQMPPYGLPANVTQSGWKSNSSPGGGGWNELRFEDKAGSEEVYFQAQKDHNELIKHNESRTIGNDFAEDVGHDAKQGIAHDRTESVGNDKAVSVGNNRTVSIGVNDTESVGSNRSLSVGSDETISIGSSSTETIGLNHTQTVAVAQTITVGAMRTDSVGGMETRSVGAVQSNTIGASRSVTVGAGQTHAIGADDGWTIGAGQTVTIAAGQTVSIGADQGVTVGAAQTLSVAADQSVSVGANRTTKVTGNDALAVDGDGAMVIGKNFTLEVADQITLKCGSAVVVMKKDGTISINGKDVSVDASGKINMKASSEISAKGSKINLNS